ncbi:hypothetical protein [Amycolatopsis panacis]|uniref:Uncharacterized protein n=1 Tax=Amycolatopsis panacis TaxID=2340917 RepID=A0A419HLD1_9PSEU|nr:hypothetical protein [Amycolatopsis panacis]RJQ76908.1 hypothetical protein D5S19_29290 [Amycolatopsis panacis]
MKGIVGSGWGRDPAEAFGKLVANIGLIAVTGAAGAAGDVATGADKAAVEAAGQPDAKPARLPTGWTGLHPNTPPIPAATSRCRTPPAHYLAEPDGARAGRRAAASG